MSRRRRPCGPWSATLARPARLDPVTTWLRRRPRTSASSRSGSSGSLVSSVGQVAVGSMVANVCAYFVHLPASRWLSPDQYGEFAVLLQATLVLGVPALAIQ